MQFLLDKRQRFCNRTDVAGGGRQKLKEASDAVVAFRCQIYEAIMNRCGPVLLAVFAVKLLFNTVLPFSYQMAVSGETTVVFLSNKNNTIQISQSACSNHTPYTLKTMSFLEDDIKKYKHLI